MTMLTRLLIALLMLAIATDAEGFGEFNILQPFQIALNIEADSLFSLDANAMQKCIVSESSTEFRASPKSINSVAFS